LDFCEPSNPTVPTDPVTPRRVQPELIGPPLSGSGGWSLRRSGACAVGGLRDTFSSSGTFALAQSGTTTLAEPSPDVFSPLLSESISTLDPSPPPPPTLDEPVRSMSSSSRSLGLVSLNALSRRGSPVSHRARTRGTKSQPRSRSPIVSPAVAVLVSCLILLCEPMGNPSSYSHTTNYDIRSKYRFF
jgi:hypothetical protein